MRTYRIVAGASALLLIAAFTPVAQAQSPVAPKPGETVSAGTGTEEVNANAAVEAEAKAKLDELKLKIEERGSKIAPQARAKADRDIAEAQKQVESSAAADGDARIAERLGADLDMSAEALIAEKAALETSWGQLFVAHALEANAATDVTVEQLVQMKRDGMGWGKIAAGLDLHLGSVVSGIKTEAQVARGLLKADGRMAAMTGPGARAGVGVSAGVGSGLAKGHSETHAGVGVGVGVKTKP